MVSCPERVPYFRQTSQLIVRWRRVVAHRGCECAHLSVLLTKAWNSGRSEM